jgi:hypothetical protein
LDQTFVLVGFLIANPWLNISASLLKTVLNWHTSRAEGIAPQLPVSGVIGE